MIDFASLAFPKKTKRLLAIRTFPSPESDSIIRDYCFHFRVRNGNGWFTIAYGHQEPFVFVRNVPGLSKNSSVNEEFLVTNRNPVLSPEATSAGGTGRSCLSMVTGPLLFLTVFKPFSKGRGGPVSSSGLGDSDIVSFRSFLTGHVPLMPGKATNGAGPSAKFWRSARTMCRFSVY